MGEGLPRVEKASPVPPWGLPGHLSLGIAGVFLELAGER